MRIYLLIFIFLSIVFSCVKQDLPYFPEGVTILRTRQFPPIQDSIKRFLERSYLDFAYVDFDGTTDSVLRINVTQTRRFTFYSYDPVRSKEYWLNDCKEITEGPGFHRVLLLYLSSKGRPVTAQTTESIRLDWHLDFYKDQKEETFKLFTKSTIDDTEVIPI